jgi:hypothetical protein
MRSVRRRLNRLGADTGASGDHTLTIRYGNHWQEPVPEPSVRVVPGLEADTAITIVYREDWRNERDEAMIEAAMTR